MQCLLQHILQVQVSTHPTRNPQMQHINTNYVRLSHCFPLNLNRYKISFIALDGTDEAEMICFGDVARRIIGKSVQQLLKTATSGTTYPPEVARIVSLRFTFAVALTQQSYYRRQKTYQVVSVVTAYGRQPAAAAPVKNQNAEHSDSGGDNQNTSQNTCQDVEEVSDVALSSPLLTDVSSVFVFYTYQSLHTSPACLADKLPIHPSCRPLLHLLSSGSHHR